MSWSQMQSRCPRAQFRGIALLADHRLAFTRLSKSRGCGVADAVAARGQKLWGVLYDLDEADLATLDTYEGYKPGRPKNSYWRKNCLVVTGADASRQAGAITYFAEKQPNPPLPNREYKALILRGAKEWRLPGEYLAQLQAIAVSG